VALEVPWPSGFKEFVSFWSFANFDLVQASNVECLVEEGQVSETLAIAPKITTTTTTTTTT
jgi:hypothetical protein